MLDLAAPESVGLWLSHAALGEASFDNAVHAASGPVYSGQPCHWEWPVNGFLSWSGGHARPHEQTIYVGLYGRGYGEANADVCAVTPSDNASTSHCSAGGGFAPPGPARPCPDTPWPKPFQSWVRVENASSTYGVRINGTPALAGVPFLGHFETELACRQVRTCAPKSILYGKKHGMSRLLWPATPGRKAESCVLVCQACEQLSNCTQYDWNRRVPKWEKGCYSRCDSVWDLWPNASGGAGLGIGFISGAGGELLRTEQVSARRV